MFQVWRPPSPPTDAYAPPVGCGVWVGLRERGPTMPGPGTSSPISCNDLILLHNPMHEAMHSRFEFLCPPTYHHCYTATA